MKFSYKRVSTELQNLDRQLHGMDFDREFIEKVSAKNTDRPELQNLLGILREDDEVHVHELSRLARNTKDLLGIVEQILNSGASIHFHKENLLFLAGERHLPVQDLMLSLLAAIAQFERDLILERQREGITLAKQRGVYKGKQSKFTNDDIADIKEQFEKAKNKSALAKKLGISRGHLYKLVKPQT